MTALVNPAPAAARQALSDRLRAVADHLLGTPLDLEPNADPAADAAAVLDRLVTAVAGDPAPKAVWLLLTALSSAYPTRDEVDSARRLLELDEPFDAAIELLGSSLERAQRFGEPLARLEVLTGAVIIDVDHTARFNLHTGIQRVARNLMPHWQHRAGVVPVAWTTGGGILRRLDERETERVYDWDRRGAAGEPPDYRLGRSDGDLSPVLVVPFDSIVVMVEVPRTSVSDRIAALADHSGNTVVGIGYDAIPVVSADLVPPVESSKFVRYLTAVKFAARMACISTAATAELAGFVQMLSAQGLPGPSVTEVSLPAPPTPDTPVPVRVQPPLVLAVGSHEPRKNHLAILHAAETLWRQDLRFDLKFIGGSGWGDDFPRLAADLARAGRPVEVLRAVDDRTLDQAFRDASFTLFPSLHEGYGLPVVESLAHGTPVITSDFGSTAEIASGGGALTIDPRDDQALIAAMRLLLTDVAALSELRRQIGERATRSWADYADELWESLVVPGRGRAAGATRGRNGGVG